MFFILLTALVQASPVYVQASLLNLRDAPDPGARVEAWVRIGTAVEVDDERGDWVHVSLVDRPDEYPVEGWVLGRFLNTERPTVATNLQTVDLEEREARHAALTGIVDDIVGQTHFAVCDGRRVEYLGYFDASGDLVRRVAWDASAQDLMDLSAHHWTAVEPDGQTGAIQGSPFVRPFRTESWNEENASAFVPGTCRGICEGDHRVILGPCDRTGTVYTSRRSTGIEPQPVDKGTRAAARQSAPGSLQTDLSRRGIYTEGVSWHATDSKRTGTWMITGYLVEARVVIGERDTSTDIADPVAPMRTFVDIPGIGVLGLAEARRQTGRGWIVVRVEELGFDVWPLYVEGWGC